MTKRRSNRTLVAASIGNFGEIYDFAVFGFSVPVLAIHFFPGVDRTAALLSTFAVYAVAFFARPLGGLLFGIMADRVGRIRILSTTVWLMAAGTAMIGLLPTYAELGVAAPVLLLFCRIAQGLAMGGETTGSTSFTLESAPDDQRGRWIGWTWFYAFVPNSAVAVVLMLLRLGAGPTAYADWVWRIPFLLGGLIGVVGFWLRRNLDDPDEFKQAVRTADSDNPLLAATRNGLKSMVHVVLLQAVLAVGAYLLLGFMYTFLVREAKLDSTLALLTNAAAITVMAAMIPIGGILSDKYGRKPILKIGAAWVALTAYPAVYLAASGTVLGALAGQSLVALGVGFYGGAAFTAMPELFPTKFRATGHAISYQLSVAILGGTTPFIGTLLVKVTGSPLAPGLYAAIMAVVGLIAIHVVPETRGVRLRTSVEDNSQQQERKIIRDAN